MSINCTERHPSIESLGESSPNERAEEPAMPESCPLYDSCGLCRACRMRRAVGGKAQRHGVANAWRVPGPESRQSQLHDGPKHTEVCRMADLRRILLGNAAGGFCHGAGDCFAFTERLFCPVPAAGRDKALWRRAVVQGPGRAQQCHALYL